MFADSYDENEKSYVEEIQRHCMKINVNKSELKIINMGEGLKEEKIYINREEVEIVKLLISW